MPIKKLYHTLQRNIKLICPGERITRLRNFTWLMIGLFKSRSVHLSRIASKIPGAAKLTSQTRRIQRWLCNSAINVRTWYEPVARRVLAVYAGQQICLIVDGSKVGFGHQLLMVAIAYRKRAIPLAWTWVNKARGHSSAKKQIELLTYVYGLIPPKTRVILTGDAEFGAVEVQKQLEKWHWGYIVRQKGQHLVKLKHKRNSRRLDTLVVKPGQMVWLQNCRLTAKHLYHVNVLAYWQTGEKDPWLLATNLDCSKTVLRFYRKRMWIEEMFGDLKGNGFDLESTHLNDENRLSRLTLAVVLLYVWLLAFGSQVIKIGKRHLVDRHDRRDHSLFRIGWNMAERCLINDLPLSISFKFHL